MIRTLTTIIMLALMSTVARAERWIGTQEDSLVIVRVLADAKQRKVTNSMPLYFARKLMGRPYVAHTLEVGNDHSVVVNTRQLDCTTLVETVTALTLCAKNGLYSFNAYTEMLKQLRYRGGKMNGYTSRLHYFTDWIEDNSKDATVEERNTKYSPFTAVQTIQVGYMSAHPSAYKALREHPEYVAEIQNTEKALNGRRYRYIPKSKVLNTAQMRSIVNDGDIIAITCNKKGLEIAHLGFAVWRKDGLHLLNASMIHHKVVEETKTLYQYLKEHKSHTGIRIIRINK